jgi:hypothetical protein
MGEVFFGRSRAGRPVAIKLIYPIFVNDVEFRRRFRLEVEAGRKVGGYHGVQVLDADPDAERPWIMTAYVAGPSLEQVLSGHLALLPPTLSVQRWSRTPSRPERDDRRVLYGPYPSGPRERVFWRYARRDSTMSLTTAAKVPEPALAPGSGAG